MTKPYTLHLGDCIEVMRTLADNSVNSIVCDPPYGLEFMGKEWDGADGFRRSLNKADVGRENVFGRASRTSPEYRAGHLLQEWCEAWATEALRVLKPGGHLLAFSGSRTYHRMTCAIEDAGFEIRDQIMLVYGSGFPKSLDVSKAIDKAAPRAGMFDAFAQHYAERRAATGMTHNAICAAGGFHGEYNHGGASTNWEKGNSVPTMAQWPVLKRLLGLSDEWLPLIERTEAEREKIGEKRSGISDPDGTPRHTIGAAQSVVVDITAPATDAARQWEGWGTALKPAHEPICVARKPLIGTVAANVLQFGTGAINIDGCRVGTDGGTTRGENGSNAGKERNVLHGGNFGIEKLDAGRWPANLIHDGSAEVVALFPQAKSGGNVSGKEPSAVTNGIYGEFDGRVPFNGYSDTGSAARFFYCAKASRKDRNEGLPTGTTPAVSNGATMREREDADWSARNGNHHPTVKPTDLMAYLCRLVTPPGGLVLDPFMGSGSTGKACMREGFRFVGIDMTPEYVEIATARIEHELGKVQAAREEAERAEAERAAEPEQLSLLG